MSSVALTGVLIFIILHCSSVHSTTCAREGASCIFNSDCCQRVCTWLFNCNNNTDIHDLTTSYPPSWSTFVHSSVESISKQDLPTSTESTWGPWIHLSSSSSKPTTGHHTMPTDNTTPLPVTKTCYIPGASCIFTSDCCRGVCTWSFKCHDNTDDESTTHNPPSKSTSNPWEHLSTKQTLGPWVDSSAKPTRGPWEDSSTKPTWRPWEDPSIKPTWGPWEHLSTKPTWGPWEHSSMKPTWGPWEDLSTKPTWGPSEDSSTKPTWGPWEHLSTKPTWGPWEDPSTNPTLGPWEHPSVKTTSWDDLLPSTETDYPWVDPFLPTTEPTTDHHIIPDNNTPLPTNNNCHVPGTRCTEHSKCCLWTCQLYKLDPDEGEWIGVCPIPMVPWPPFDRYSFPWNAIPSKNSEESNIFDEHIDPHKSRHGIGRPGRGNNIFV